MVDKAGLGGQAGVTERIDNYPGFPDGIGGQSWPTGSWRRPSGTASSYCPLWTLPRWGGMGMTAACRDRPDIAASAVLLAPGSTYRRLGVPGEEDLIGAGVHFCATCDGPFYKGARSSSSSAAATRRSRKACS